MKTRRLFLAIRPDAGILKDLLTFQQALKDSQAYRRLAPRCRWLVPEQLHLTLHFLGNVDETRVPALLKMAGRLTSKSGYRHSDLLLDEGFAFPKPQAAIVAGVGASVAGAPLLALWGDLGQALTELALPVEKRPFYAHVCVLRFRQPVTAPSLQPSPPLRFPIETLCLYHSRLGRGGARYETLGEFPLAAASQP
jgi:2'-5' RNA ligase